MKRVSTENFFSTQRFDRYLEACGNNEEIALEAYKSNLLVSQSFYPLLSVFEVALRNRTNQVLSEYFRDSDWLINQASPSGFMSDPTLSPGFLNCKQIDSAVDHLKKDGLSPRRQLITKLTLAFWVRLFQPDYFRLLKAEPIKVFPKIPKSTKSRTIHVMLKSVLDLRNRIYHNEPICLGSDRRTGDTIIDCSQPQRVYENLYDLMFWFGDPNLIHWLTRIDSFSIEGEKLNNLISKIGKGIPFLVKK